MKVSIDDGRSKLKMSVSLVPKYGFEETENQKKFLEGFKVTGVKRIILLAVAPVKESPHNLKVLLGKLEIHNWPFEYKIAADLSCVNKLLGIGNHKSKYCCYICHWNQYDCEGKTKGAQKRTFQSLKGDILTEFVDRPLLCIQIPLLLKTPTPFSTLAINDGFEINAFNS